MKVYLARAYYSDGSGQELLGVRASLLEAQALLGRYWIDEGSGVAMTAEIVDFELDEPGQESS
mgnify:CR=1 FL=1